MYGQNFKRASLSGVLLSAVVLLNTCAPDIGVTLPDCTGESVKAWLRDTHIEPNELNAEYLVEHCGAEALLPHLANVLSDSSFGVREQAFAAMAIGKTGEAGAEALLINFIEIPRTSPIDSIEEFDQISFALYALGFHGSDRSIAYLNQLCGVEYWQGRGDQQFFDISETENREDTPVYTSKHMRRLAVAGLSASEAPKALDTLKELRANGVVNDVYSPEMLDELIRTFGQREKGRSSDVIAN